MVKHQYKREEYDILTFFGDIGGLTDCIIVFGWVLSSALVSRLFQAALVQSVYRWQRYNEDKTPYYETSIAGQLSGTSKDVSYRSDVSSSPPKANR